MQAYCKYMYVYILDLKFKNETISTYYDKLNHLQLLKDKKLKWWTYKMSFDTQNIH